VNYYFAYGSNMNPERVVQRGIEFEYVMGGYVRGYALRFDKKSRDFVCGGHANIAYEVNGLVEGVVYQLSHADEILKMDPFESAPIDYSRELIRVETASGDLWAWTYFANAALIASGLKPPREYMDHLLAGDVFLSSRYVAWLRSFACI
jgi:hypothetical protein